MFDIGFLELMLTAVVALLVLGPERLPHAARTAGRWIGQAKRMMNHFSEELDREVQAKDLADKLRQNSYEVGVDQINLLSERIGEGSPSPISVTNLEPSLRETAARAPSST
ncbi:MAG: twin-arginine translocase subunit TatB [Hahellaceae bacterium]|nr:twin-arginine translocase subunit TatB [Hahellaceae bacterium]